MTARKLTYRRDLPDDRDEPFDATRVRARRTSLPLMLAAGIVMLPITSRVSDQGGVGSCVCNAACDGFELLDDKPEPEQLSRLDLYMKCRLQLGEECLDEGTYPRTALRMFSKLGVCRESIWPYDVSKVFVRPPIAALQDGYDHRISGYYRIITKGLARGADVRTAIDHGHPVIFGTDVGQPFCDYDGTREDLFWEYPAHPVGGHSMLIVGYRQRSDGRFGYLVRNSWGEDWGSRAIPGHAWVSEEYMHEFTDLWVLTRKDET